LAFPHAYNVTRAGIPRKCSGTTAANVAIHDSNRIGALLPREGDLARSPAIVQG